MERSIAGVFRAHFTEYARHRRLPLHQHRAASLIARCGRSAMGGHLERCPCTATERLVWHSCKHRLCPRCARKAKAEWLTHEFECLLPCAHHHLIFTLPHDLLPLWRFNRRLMADLLFETAAATLTELLADPKYLGARPGLLLTLHTWSRAAALHPHVHALVTDGGLADGQWRTPRRSHFLPARVVKALFRGKFLSALGRRLTAGELRLPTDCSPERVKSLINRLGRVSWHVWLTHRYDHGEGVLLYLARYLRGGPLRDSQLLHADHERIVFRYQSNDAPPATLSLHPNDWLQRYLEHVPSPGQHSLRRYGLYATASRAPCQLARDLIPTPVTRALPRRFARHPPPHAVLSSLCTATAFRDAPATPAFAAMNARVTLRLPVQVAVSRRPGNARAAFGQTLGPAADLPPPAFIIPSASTPMTRFLHASRPISLHHSSRYPSSHHFGIIIRN